MANVDKNQAIIEYLIKCPEIANNPLFFNFADEKDNNNQISTRTADVAINKPFIDGSVEKRFLFTLNVYKSLSFIPLVKDDGYPDENVSDLLDVQSILDWVEQKNEEKDFPNFGDLCIIESIEAMTNEPDLVGITTKSQPAIAQYRINIKITYLDTSKMIWS